MTHQREIPPQGQGHFIELESQSITFISICNTMV